MTKVPKKYHPEIVDAATIASRRIREAVTLLAEGLADRPKPGAKAKAREAARAIGQNNFGVFHLIQNRTPEHLRGTGDMIEFLRDDMHTDPPIVVADPVKKT